MIFILLAGPTTRKVRTKKASRVDKHVSKKAVVSVADEFPDLLITKPACLTL